MAGIANVDLTLDASSTFTLSASPGRTVKPSAAPITSVSLLDRIRRFPSDEAAWADFVARYGSAIYDWCRQWKLQEADARDVTQVVLLKLVSRLRTFEYDPRHSFRKWLWTVAHNAWLDFRADAKFSSVHSGPLEAIASRDDLLSRLDAEFDAELLAEAEARVQLRVEPRTWEAFRLTAVEGLRGAEAALRLGMTPAAVFRAKGKVLKMLSEEVFHLEAP